MHLKFLRVREDKTWRASVIQARYGNSIEVEPSFERVIWAGRRVWEVDLLQLCNVVSFGTDQPAYDALVFGDWYHAFPCKILDGQVSQLVRAVAFTVYGESMLARLIGVRLFPHQKG